MKRALVSVLVSVFVCLQGFAGNTLTVSSSLGHPGDEVPVVVSMANSDGVSAVQLEFMLDDCVKYVANSVAMNQDRSDGHSISASVSGDRLRIVIVNMGLKTIKGSTGELCSFSLKLGKEPATYSLQPSAVLSDVGGAKLSCGIGGGTVTILSPKISLSASALDFGSVPVLSSGEKTLTISNTGNEPLHITSITVSGSDFSVSESAVTIAAGTSKPVFVSYAPKAKTESTETISIVSDAVNGTQSVALSAASYTVNEIHLADAAGLAGEEVEIAVQMNNMEDIAAGQFVINLPEELQYVAGSVQSLHTSHSAYAAQNGSELKLMFYSPLSGVVAAGDAELMRFRVKLIGSSGAYLLTPQNVVLGNSALENVCSASYGSTVMVKSSRLTADDALDMDSCDISVENIREYVVRNDGLSTLELKNVTFVTDGNLTADSQGFRMLTPVPLYIASGKEYTLQVGFAPSEEGNINTTMNIYTNDPDRPMHSVSLTGVVYTPNQLTVSGNVDATNNLCRVSVGMKNLSDIVAIQADIHVHGLSLEQSSLSASSRLSKHVTSIHQIEDGVYRLVAYSVGNEVITGSEGGLVAFDCVATDASQLKGRIVSIDNIKLSDIDGTNKCSLSYVEYTNASTGILGDTNGDGTVDVSDAVLLINHYLSGTEDIDMNVSDINKDGIIDITDIVGLINIYMQ